MRNNLELSPVMKKFILHWGEMGTRWGINRTVAQVHALLYLSPEPLNAEDIASTLSIARSTVSTSLRELQVWGIIRVVHGLGDRKDHFETIDDVWELFRVVLEERKRREVDPTLALLRETVTELEEEGDMDSHTRTRLSEMLEFFETMTSLYEQFQELPASALRRLTRISADVRKLLLQISR